MRLAVPLRTTMLAATFLMPLVACQNPAPPAVAPPTASEAPAMPVHDVNSYAEPEQVTVKHLVLELTVDFERKVLAGAATLDLAWKDPASRQLLLDTRDLAISKVEGGDGTAWQELKFELAPRDAILGSKLVIALPAQLPKVRIGYSSSPDASGLQWLTPPMTLGKKTPFMFSQSQAIHARSWVPLQDTPGVRFTYDAHITAPSSVMAVMSADNDPKAVRDGDYRFTMPQPIPSYLMAIAAGDLVFRPINERAGVWAETAMADKAAKEFEDTGKMIDTAEALYGPYRWGRYDLLVLPPSFPFGGMENPRLTFATPTIVVGDKSLVSLIAHELAHSWSGNLVTNSSWKDIWLNEGFTTYVQDRIVESLFGAEVSDMEQVIARHGLAEELKEMKSADQVLVLPPLTNRDPDEGLTSVAYIKGQWFLTFLEERYGRAVFDPFLRKWFDDHAFTSTDSAEFERFLNAELVAKNPGKTTAAELQAWLHEPGIPAFAPVATSKRLDAIDEARGQWLSGHRAPADIDASKWSTQEWVHFIGGMPETLTVAQLGQLDAAWRFSGTANGEIAQRWFPLTVRSGYTAARPGIAAFLATIGRRKLIMPTYTALAKTPDGLAFARDVFAKARPALHPITIASIETALADPKPATQ